MKKSFHRPSVSSVPFGRLSAVRTSLYATVGAAALLTLSGCYYYPSAYGYAPAPYYSTAPAPAVAAAPAYYPSYYPAYYPAYPAYAYPSVSVGIGGYWGGGGHWRR
ncbi:MAG TPA: hypothetical protein VGG24_01220 [Paraburkholderia sp.]|jgi:hypothetical protein